MKLEIKKIGNSTGLILPKELLARLGLSQGDNVVVSETPDGFKVSRYDQTFERGWRCASRKGHEDLPQCAQSARQMSEPVWLRSKWSLRSKKNSCGSSAGLRACAIRGLLGPLWIVPRTSGPTVR